VGRFVGRIAPRRHIAGFSTGFARFCTTVSVSPIARRVMAEGVNFLPAPSISSQEF
jgi:hypothetical protein